MVTAAVGEPMKSPGYLLATGTYWESRECSNGAMMDVVRTIRRRRKRVDDILIPNMNYYHDDCISLYVRKLLSHE